MALHYFRFDFKGKEGSRNNSFITLKHERPQHGEITVGISRKEDDEERHAALADIYHLSQKLNKKVRKYAWNYHDAVLVETQGFDTDLGIMFSSRLEKQGIVPQGSTEKFKKGLREEGHEVQEKDLSVFMDLLDDPNVAQQKINEKEKAKKEKRRLFRLFLKRKPGRSR